MHNKKLKFIGKW